eukprot:COSAG01_NODE_37811_length_498_cov_1.751880_1_plen_20_part_10
MVLERMVHLVVGPAVFMNVL